ncbi:MAG: type II toxin-antitoxin system RelE/ParE family toxin [Bacteroidetes bacterium]|nr:type II toxin-antitoxin system RelE/ParE family toxin [Bacteroidota bacterium]
MSCAVAGRITYFNSLLETFPRCGRMAPEVGDKAIREVIFRGFRTIYVVTDDDADVDILTVFRSTRPVEGQAL